MTKNELLSAWMAAKIVLVEYVSSNAKELIEHEKIGDKEPSWEFIYGVGGSNEEIREYYGTSYKDFAEKHPPALKPFYYYHIPYDPGDVASLKIFAFEADIFHDLLSHVELSKLDLDDFINIDEQVSQLIGSFYSFWGHQTRKIWARWPYINGPGAASREIGNWTAAKAKEVLEKYGGHEGYKALPRGQKKHVIEEIAAVTHLKDIRNAYNLIKKVGGLSVSRKVKS